MANAESHGYLWPLYCLASILLLFSIHYFPNFYHSLRLIVFGLPFTTYKNIEYLDLEDLVES
jgi:hypothetical protein